jgi:hypothetical protein
VNRPMVLITQSAAVTFPAWWWVMRVKEQAIVLEGTPNHKPASSSSLRSFHLRMRRVRCSGFINERIASARKFDTRVTTTSSSTPARRSGDNGSGARYRHQKRIGCVQRLKERAQIIRTRFPRARKRRTPADSAGMLSAVGLESERWVAAGLSAGPAFIAQWRATVS